LKTPIVDDEIIASTDDFIGEFEFCKSQAAFYMLHLAFAVKFYLTMEKQK
jgi:hypothetical protein